MKSLSYLLISTFLVLFNICREEENCKALTDPIAVIINPVLIDSSQDQSRCQYGFAVDFW